MNIDVKRESVPRGDGQLNNEQLDAILGSMMAGTQAEPIDLEQPLRTRGRFRVPEIPAFRPRLKTQGRGILVSESNYDI